MVPGMNLKDQLVLLGDTYAKATGCTITTVSTYAMNDGKRLDALRGGAQITTARYEAAVSWFKDHWPKGLDWPLSHEAV